MKKILIVDDEENVRVLISATLCDNERFELVMAGDGQEALAMARSTRPDLVFLDVRMPKMSGLEVCQALKNDIATVDIKVIMLTAMAQESDKQRAMEAGADGYFTKPFSPTALLETVDEALGVDA